MIVTLQAGDGSGRTATVNDSGQLLAAVENVVSVTGAITVQRRTVTVERTFTSVGVSSGQVLGTRSQRSGLWIQNKSTTKSLFVRFGSSSATNNDWKIAPGGELRTEGLQCEQAVQAIASDADTDVLLLEMVEA